MAYQGKGTYLENYLESISTLPIEVNRSFALIKELDLRTNELVEKLEKAKTNLVMTTNQTKRTAMEYIDERNIKKIQNDIKNVLEYADEKVELANQTYELIDRHIRRLDIDLKKFESELETMEDEKKKKKSKTTLESKKGASRSESSGSLNSEGTHHHHHRPITSTSHRKNKISSSTGGDDKPPEQADLDMAIDPNEPTYCICNSVSYGEMVGCENADCKIEWFHFACVGLTSTPKGKWYCPDCSKKRGLKT
ncbi:PHD zinc finger-containing protein [Tieghemostelium lacteum]|uniref:Inhibitor of growth protein n=1 Tax=Tieghemostelium lacteum TaxID=361077 RepID=A0A152A4F1_TIELA|nr:PHD zinc finger-containing protein [Tieghemostelium lacteum]|eukprot:KYR01094.1 PHD zinc finger-containing protein [Tieghemostelium lacteum]